MNSFSLAASVSTVQHQAVRILVTIEVLLCGGGLDSAGLTEILDGVGHVFSSLRTRGNVQRCEGDQPRGISDLTAKIDAMKSAVFSTAAVSQLDASSLLMVQNPWVDKLCEKRSLSG